MGDVTLKRDLFLWCMSVIYLCAFSSLFVQIPGLYGDNGILPARNVIQKEAESFSDLILAQPTLLRLIARLGLDVTTGMDLICIGGIILSFAAMVSQRQRNAQIFFLLWVFYLSLFQVGQTFMWFQWDTLLLEIGFLTALVAPFKLFGIFKSSYPHDTINLWLIKWLLFRLMFSSGVVKLTSGCPTWWGLTALSYHFETQCIPTPLAWFFHNFPDWIQKFSVVMTFIILIPTPFLFFSPIRGHRLFAFLMQMTLQILIIATGNYNFFNLLAIASCLSLLDDTFIRDFLGKPTIDNDSDSWKSKLSAKKKLVVNISLGVTLLAVLLYYFEMKIVSQPFFHVSTKIAFTKEEFNKFLIAAMPIGIFIAGVSLMFTIFSGLWTSIRSKGFLHKVINVLGCIVFAIIAVLMFFASLADYTRIERNYYNKLHPFIFKLHETTNLLSLTSSYGLFRSMTGVGGRPEVIIEGSNSLSGPWKEYDFQYKPGNLSKALPYVAPHQPRLDWQMWFAALGSYHQNPWFLNLCYRILNNQPEVMELMGKNPFEKRAPRYLRAHLYHYHFTSTNDSSELYSGTDWWVREKVSDYLPIISKEEPTFINYLKKSGIIASGKKVNTTPNYLMWLLQLFRNLVGQPEGFYTCLSFFFTGLILSFLDPAIKLETES